MASRLYLDLGVEEKKATAAALIEASDDETLCRRAGEEQEN